MKSEYKNNLNKLKVKTFKKFIVIMLLNYTIEIRVPPLSTPNIFELVIIASLPV